jgi:hypothetical protein
MRILGGFLLITCCALLIAASPALAGADKLPAPWARVGGDTKTGGDDPGQAIVYDPGDVIVPDAKLPGYWNRNDKLDQGKYHKLATSSPERVLLPALPTRSSAVLIVVDDPMLPDMERIQERLERQGVTIILASWSELGASVDAAWELIEEAYEWSDPAPLHVFLLGEAAVAGQLAGLEGEIAPDLFVTPIETELTSVLR